MKVVLELQDQPSNIRRVTVRHDIVIGRGSECNLRLSAPQVSRRHCFLRVGREGVSVTDLDSSNGTYVDGNRIKPGSRCELIAGSALSVGPIKFVVRIKEDAVSADVLKAGTLSEAVPNNTSGRAEDNSTVDEKCGLLDLQGFAGAGRPLNMAVEQGGSSADPDEPTEGMQDAPGQRSKPAVPRNRQRPELTDSRAEVIDLGRRIAEMDAQAAACNADEDTFRGLSAVARREQPTSANVDFLQGDFDLLQVVDDEEVIDVFEDAELLEVVDVEEFIESDEHDEA